MQFRVVNGFFLDKRGKDQYNNSRSTCGRGGIGIRARLRGVSSNGYGFKSRRPHEKRFASIKDVKRFFIQLCQ